MRNDTSPTLRVAAGTAAGVMLAETLAGRFAGRFRVAVTLAGTRRVPKLGHCIVDRVGGTDPDGAEAVIDALDPFDRRTIRALREAARHRGIPRLAFRPPVWERHPLDRWVEVRDLAGAVDSIASVARTALLALPLALVPAFRPVGGLRFPVRADGIPARWDLPPRFPIHLASATRSIAGETRLLQRTEAQAVVMRATGSAEEAPTVVAARRLDLPIVMIRRPRERGTPPARSVEAAVDWVAAVLDRPIEVMDATAWR